MDGESGRAIVFHDKNPVEVPFRNFSAAGRREPNIIEEQVYGVLIVFNAFEEIIDPTRQLKDDVRKMIEGLSSEIAVAYVEGYKVIYYTSFKKYAKWGEDHLPREFTSSDDDLYHNKATKKDMIETIHSYLPRLHVVRFAGIVSKPELEELATAIKKDDIKFETDSPYLVVVDK